MSKHHLKMKHFNFIDKYKRGGGFFPDVVRGIILGESGSGKTFLSTNFVANKWLPYRQLYVYSPSIDQPTYVGLEKELEKDKYDIDYLFEGNWEKILPVEECASNSLVIFDDGMLKDQSKIIRYYCEGRHKNISILGLYHKYTKINPIIRKNSNLWFIFNEFGDNLRKIHEELASELTYEEFCKFCKKAWSEPHGFLGIDKTKNDKYFFQKNNELILLL